MDFTIFDLGLADFARAADFQKEIFNRVKSGSCESALIVCRHKPVITLGRRARRSNIIVAEEQLREKAVAVCAIERGGDVTYHGPGQLTAYPVFNLALLKKDIHFFLRRLEDVGIAFLKDFSIAGYRLCGLTGVWAGKAKVCSIGIAIKSWITFHGLSINIKKDDLSNFSLIRPCGMDIAMTSLETLAGREIDMENAKIRLIDKFRVHFTRPTA